MIVLKIAACLCLAIIGIGFLAVALPIACIVGLAKLIND